MRISKDQLKLNLESKKEMLTLEEVNRKILNCRRCPNPYEYPELGFGDTEEILFIGIAPAESNVGKLRGNSKFDLYFKKILHDIEFTEKFYFTNIHKTIMKENFKLTEELKEHLLEHIKEEIYAVNPKKIICLGKIPSLCFDLNFRENKKIIIYDREYDIYSIQHPSWLIKSLKVDDVADWLEHLTFILKQNGTK